MPRQGCGEGGSDSSTMTKEEGRKGEREGEKGLKLSGTIIAFKTHIFIFIANPSAKEMYWSRNHDALLNINKSNALIKMTTGT